MEINLCGDGWGGDKPLWQRWRRGCVEMVSDKFVFCAALNCGRGIFFEKTVKINRDGEMKDVLTTDWLQT